MSPIQFARTLALAILAGAGVAAAAAEALALLINYLSTSIDPTRPPKFAASSFFTDRFA